MRKIIVLVLFFNSFDVFGYCGQGGEGEVYCLSAGSNVAFSTVPPKNRIYFNQYDDRFLPFRVRANDPTSKSMLCGPVDVLNIDQSIRQATGVMPLVKDAEEYMRRVAAYAKTEGIDITTGLNPRDLGLLLYAVYYGTTGKFGKMYVQSTRSIKPKYDMNVFRAPFVEDSWVKDNSKGTQIAMIGTNKYRYRNGNVGQLWHFVHVLKFDRETNTMYFRDPAGPYFDYSTVLTRDAKESGLATYSLDYFGKPFVLRSLITLQY